MCGKVYHIYSIYDRLLILFILQPPPQPFQLSDPPTFILHGISRLCTMQVLFLFFYNRSFLLQAKYLCTSFFFLSGFFHKLYFLPMIFPDLNCGHLRDLVDSALDQISRTPEFESRHWHILRVFHLLFRFITFGGRSAIYPNTCTKVAVKHQSSSSS